MDRLDLIQKKFDLVTSEKYQEIKKLQLENILQLSSTGIDPTILKGMLLGIYSTDIWEQEFYSEKNKK